MSIFSDTNFNVFINSLEVLFNDINNPARTSRQGAEDFANNLKNWFTNLADEDSIAEEKTSGINTLAAGTVQNQLQSLLGLAGSGSHETLTNNPHSVTITQAVTADAGTDIVVSELETLTDGSNSDSLHSHISLTTITIEDLISAVGSGTNLLTSGAATTPTAIDLSSVAVEDDLVFLLYSALNTGAASQLDFFYDSDGDDLAHSVPSVSNSAGGYNLPTGYFPFRVGSSPSASLYYSWSSAPSTGANLFATFIIQAVSINWT